MALSNRELATKIILIVVAIAAVFLTAWPLFRTYAQEEANAVV